MSSLYFVAKIVSTLTYLKMAENIINKIVLQDELLIILALGVIKAVFVNINTEMP